MTVLPDRRVRPIAIAHRDEGGIGPEARNWVMRHDHGIGRDLDHAGRHRHAGHLHVAAIRFAGGH